MTSMNNDTLLNNSFSINPSNTALQTFIVELHLQSFPTELKILTTFTRCSLISYWSTVFVLVLLVQFSSPQCLSEDDIVSPEDHPLQLIHSLENASSQFAIDLFKKIAAQENHYTDNVLISPFSVWSILVTASLGANGETALQMTTALHRPRSQETCIKHSLRLVQRSCTRNSNIFISWTCLYFEFSQQSILQMGLFPSENA